MDGQDTVPSSNRLVASTGLRGQGVTEIHGTAFGSHSEGSEGAVESPDLLARHRDNAKNDRETQVPFLIHSRHSLFPHHYPDAFVSAGNVFQQMKNVPHFLCSSILGGRAQSVMPAHGPAGRGGWHRGWPEARRLRRPTFPRPPARLGALFAITSLPTRVSGFAPIHPGSSGPHFFLQEL